MSDRGSVGALASVAVVALAVPVLLAFATIDPPPLPVKHRNTHAGVATIAAVAPSVAAPAATVAPPPVSSPVSAPVSTAVSTPAAARPPALPRRHPRRRRSCRRRHKRRTWRRSASTTCASGPARTTLPPWRSLAGACSRASTCRRIRRPVLAGCCARPHSARPQSAFNGRRDVRARLHRRHWSLKAAEWYRKAADAGLPTAKHNLALLLRDGKGVARDVEAAVQLQCCRPRIRAWPRRCSPWATSTSRVTAAPEGSAAALAWFAVTGEYERQINRDGESALAKTAASTRRS